MNLLSTEKNLQLEIIKKLSELFNNAYKEYSGLEQLEENYFKFTSILDYDYDSYNQYDISGDLITDNKGKPIKYYSVQVGEIMGDREANPDVFISDILVPVSMLIPEEDVKDVLETINVFNQEIIAKVFDIEYNLPNKIEKFKLTLLPNMPTFNEFKNSQGVSFKLVEFELIGVLSCGVAYGNQIKYSLSIDNQNWYTFTKIEPTTSRNKDLHVDQIINEERTKASEKTVTWGKDISIIAKTNDFLTKILLLNAECIRNDNFWLKIEMVGFNMSGIDDEYYDSENDTFTIIKKVELSELNYADDIGDFISFNFSMVERY